MIFIIKEQRKKKESEKDHREKIKKTEDSTPYEKEDNSRTKTPQANSETDNKDEERENA